MQYICQTALVDYVPDHDNPKRMRRVITGKVTIPCKSKREAEDMASMLAMYPDNRVSFAGIVHYTEGGVKVILSFSDLNELATAANECISAEAFPSNIKAV